MEPRELMEYLQGKFSNYEYLFDDVELAEIERRAADEIEWDMVQLERGEVIDTSGSPAPDTTGPVFPITSITSLDQKNLIEDLKKYEMGLRPYVIDLNRCVIFPLVLVEYNAVDLVWLHDVAYKMLSDRFTEMRKVNEEIAEAQAKLDRYRQRVDRILNEGHDFLI